MTRASDAREIRNPKPTHEKAHANVGSPNTARENQFGDAEIRRKSEGRSPKGSATLSVAVSGVSPETR